MHLLESVVRDALDPAAPRAFAVRRPLRVTLANPEDIPGLLAAAHPTGCEPQEAGCEPQNGAARVAADAAAGVLGWVSLRNHPKRPELGSRRVPLAAELFIERDDVRADAGGAEPSSVPKRQRFFGLTPQQPAGLLGTQACAPRRESPRRAALLCPHSSPGSIHVPPAAVVWLRL